MSLLDRPEIKVFFLNGKGDPMKTFDATVGKVLAWLKSKGIKPSKALTLGIYYKNRAGVGVENVEWDACVPVEEIVEAEGNIKYQVLPKRIVSSVTLTGSYDLIGPALELYGENNTGEWNTDRVAVD